MLDRGNVCSSLDIVIVKVVKTIPQNLLSVLNALQLISTALSTHTMAGSIVRWPQSSIQHPVLFAVDNYGQMRKQVN
jgi:hypothetical protein